MKTTFQASNGRLYKVVRPASLDYYVWAVFLDNPGKEVMIMHSSNAKKVC